MGMLVDGNWRDEDPPAEIGKAGNFQRVDSAFRDRITADGSSGLQGRGRAAIISMSPTPVRGRIARRSICALKKLEGAISVAIAIPGLREEGWTFEDNPAFPDCPPDRVNDFHYLHEAYSGERPALHRQGHGADALGQKNRSGSSTTNPPKSSACSIPNSPASAPTPPISIRQHLRAEIDRINAQVYANVNNGVYRCGFARTQAAYDEAYDALFATLDEIEARLGRQRYLVGNQITEADWRLFPTLVRFDVAYFSLFKCNRNRIADYPNLLNYMRELYAVPGVAETVKPRYYVMGYYSISRVNPTGIIPKGTPVDFRQPHDRARFAA